MSNREKDTVMVTRVKRLVEHNLGEEINEGKPVLNNVMLATRVRVSKLSRRVLGIGRGLNRQFGAGSVRTFVESAGTQEMGHNAANASHYLHIDNTDGSFLRRPAYYAVHCSFGQAFSFITLGACHCAALR